jgi:hypothetical protein
MPMVEGNEVPPNPQWRRPRRPERQPQRPQPEPEPPPRRDRLTWLKVAGWGVTGLVILRYLHVIALGAAGWALIRWLRKPEE